MNITAAPRSIKYANKESQEMGLIKIGFITCQNRTCINLGKDTTSLAEISRYALDFSLLDRLFKVVNVHGLTIGLEAHIWHF